MSAGPRSMDAWALLCGLDVVTEQARPSEDDPKCHLVDEIGGNPSWAKRKALVDYVPDDNRHDGDAHACRVRSDSLSASVQSRLLWGGTG